MKLISAKLNGPFSVIVQLENDWEWSVPFDPANTDYQRFKSDIAAGAELQDADGNVMSADDAQAFVATLP